MKEYRRKTARAAHLPSFVEPQLALLKKSVPTGGRWLHEIKYDGYRTICRIESGKVQLLTRGGHDWTEAYGNLATDLKAIPVKHALFDGEIIWPDREGRPDFQGLQNALSNEASTGFVYCVFDLLFLNGEDLRERPLIERKDLLKSLLDRVKKPSIQFSQHFRDVGQELLDQSCQLRLEGIISKDSEAPYVSGRTPAWQKIKCSERQEFVVGGYIDSESAGRGIRSLLMGVFVNGKLKYAGKVGTGFNAKSQAELQRKLKRLHAETSPFDVNSPRSRNIRWVKPKLVVDVRFAAWTGDGIIRHGSFQGLRDDKPAEKVRKEIAR